MSNTVVEGLFLLAFWAPPLVVVVGALSLIVRVPALRPSRATASAARLAH
jgi:hypothetical protein